MDDLLWQQVKHCLRDGQPAWILLSHELDPTAAAAANPTADSCRTSWDLADHLPSPSIFWDVTQLLRGATGQPGYGDLDFAASPSLFNQHVSSWLIPSCCDSSTTVINRLPKPLVIADNDSGWVIFRVRTDSKCGPGLGDWDTSPNELCYSNAVEGIFSICMLICIFVFIYRSAPHEVWRHGVVFVFLWQKLPFTQTETKVKKISRWLNVVSGDWRGDPTWLKSG